MQVLVPVGSPPKGLIFAVVTAHKGATEGEGYNDLSKADLEITLCVEHVLATVVFRFVNRVMGFAQQLKVDEGLLKTAKDTANKTAAKTVHCKRERERGGERDKDKERQRETKTKRDRERQRETEREGGSE